MQKLITVRISAHRAIVAKLRDDDHYYEAITTPMPIPAAEQARDYYNSKLVSCYEWVAFLASVGAKPIELE